jgi:hypothetical protein
MNTTQQKKKEDNTLEGFLNKSAREILREGITNK